MAQILDPHSPIPLYHQIAELLRERIRSGDLPPGAALEPLRQAARAWGVNLHTVRQAYARLAREGLVAPGRGREGTRVLRRLPSPGPPNPREVDRFLDRIRDEARRSLGMTDRELYEALQHRLAPAGTDHPVLYFVECSEWQSRCHAREIAVRWKVEARTWPLTTKGEPPDGLVLSTLHHYKDIRTLWPLRLERVHFLAARPDPALKAALGEARVARVFHRDPAGAAAAVADLTALFPGGGIVFEPLIRPLAGEAFPLDPKDSPVIFPPRAWAALDESQRADPRAVELRYLLDEGDLERLGRSQRWEQA